jgi:hypothetical protein
MVQAHAGGPPGAKDTMRESRLYADLEVRNARADAMRAGRVAAILVAGLVSLAGCQPAPRDVATQPAAGTSEATALWTLEGVVSQPRMEDGAHRAAAIAAGYAPGSTAWREARASAPAGTHPTPGALLHSVVAALDWPAALGQDAWELTSRVWRDGEHQAVGVALLWGLMDDSVLGHDVRVHMVPGGDGWRVARLEERFHCGRGVSDDDLCL